MIVEGFDKFQRNAAWIQRHRSHRFQLKTIQPHLIALPKYCWKNRDMKATVSFFVFILTFICSDLNAATCKLNFQVEDLHDVSLPNEIPMTDISLICETSLIVKFNTDISIRPTQKTRLCDSLTHGEIYAQIGADADEVPSSAHTVSGQFWLEDYPEKTTPAFSIKFDPEMKWIETSTLLNGAVQTSHRFLVTTKISDCTL